MIKTKTIVSDISEVPTNWVYRRYLTRCPVLTGQDVMIKSVFNPKDTNPSMSIYVSRGKYRFNDFSTGTKGGIVDLVMELYKLQGTIVTVGQAINKIVEDYNKHLLEGNGLAVTEFVQRAKYKPVEHPIRSWDKTDDNYWGQYELGEEDIKRFEAYPLKSYTLSNGEKSLKIQGHHIYGYFTKAGEIYKIYQPMVKDRKFLNVKSHIQGLEQLTGTEPYLIITKSLKDIAAYYKMFPEGGYISCDGEGTLLRSTLIESLRHYKNIWSAMDLDSAGERATAKYQEVYNIQPVPLQGLGLEKDISDSIKTHGSEKVRGILVQALQSLD